MTPADAKLLADIRRWAMRLGSCGRKERAADLRALADFAVESDADREARRPPSDTAPPSRRSTRTGTRRSFAPVLAAQVISACPVRNVTATADSTAVPIAAITATRA